MRTPESCVVVVSKFQDHPRCHLAVHIFGKSTKCSIKCYVKCSTKCFHQMPSSRNWCLISWSGNVRMESSARYGNLGIQDGLLRGPPPSQAAAVPSSSERALSSSSGGMTLPAVVDPAAVVVLSSVTTTDVVEGRRGTEDDESLSSLSAEQSRCPSRGSRGLSPRINGGTGAWSLFLFFSFAAASSIAVRRRRASINSNANAARFATMRRQPVIRNPRPDGDGNNARKRAIPPSLWSSFLTCG
jgi:hypothetical protein